VRVTVIEQIDNGAPDLAIESRRTRRFRLRLVVALALVVATIAAGMWWFRGGTFLRANGGGYSGVVRTNEPLSVGIDLTTASGPDVVLDSVAASKPDGVQVSWSIYRNGPGAPGFGSARGPLGPEWPTTATRGYHVSQADGHPERGATWLVTSVLAPQPGVYRISDITIKYHSAQRPRRSASHTWICLLVAAPADEARLMQQVEKFEPHTTVLSAVDPLVAQLETCIDPTIDD
jgi:hypothetical protein